jgi:hypothetical protein
MVKQETRSVQTLLLMGFSYVSSARRPILDRSNGYRRIEGNGTMISRSYRSESFEWISAGNEGRQLNWP